MLRAMKEEGSRGCKCEGSFHKDSVTDFRKVISGVFKYLYNFFFQFSVDVLSLNFFNNICTELRSTHM